MHEGQEFSTMTGKRFTFAVDGTSASVWLHS